MMFNIVRNSRNFIRLTSNFHKKFSQLIHNRGSYITNSNSVLYNSLKNSTGCSYFSSETTVQGPNIELITNGDKELEHKLKVLILEVDVMRQEGRLVPDSLKDQHWQELLKLPTISSRRRYLEYLFKIGKKEENRKIKKEQRKLERLQNKSEKREDETFEEFALKYDFQHNNLFLRIYDTTINQMYNNRLIQAMQFGQKLIVDCGYDNQMTPRENKNCAKQLMLLFAENRSHDDPFDLHYCNIDKESTLMTTLHKFITTMYEPWFPLSLHECSYLDKFPKEQLVYLTPHCREELIEYDHDAIYIIGGIVDMMNNEPLSLAKAKKERLRMAKLPLDRYLQWGAGSGKNLTLNQVAAILLDMKLTGDWKYALRHVPKRKIVDQSELKIKETYKRKWSPGSKINDKNREIRRINISNIMHD